MLTFLYPLFMSIWRDGFGKDGWGIPVYKNRFVQHVVAFAATFLLCTFSKVFVWYLALWVALWVQIEWALGHGPCYDLGKAGDPDEKMIKRYKKMMGYNLLCKIFPEDEWYSFGFDFCLLSIRYTVPLLPICVWFNPVLLTIGLVISALYAIYRYCPFAQEHRATDVELWAGFALGLYIAYL